MSHEAYRNHRSHSAYTQHLALLAQGQELHLKEQNRNVVGDMSPDKAARLPLSFPKHLYDWQSGGDSSSCALLPSDEDASHKDKAQPGHDVYQSGRTSVQSPLGSDWSRVGPYLSGSSAHTEHSLSDAADSERSFESCVSKADSFSGELSRNGHSKIEQSQQDVKTNQHVGALVDHRQSLYGGCISQPTGSNVHQPSDIPESGFIEKEVASTDQQCPKGPRCPPFEGQRQDGIQCDSRYADHRYEDMMESDMLLSGLGSAMLRLQSCMATSNLSSSGIEACELAARQGAFTKQVYLMKSLNFTD